MKKTWTINSLDDLNQFASLLVGDLQKQDTSAVITLSGDLGAGKTTLTQMIGKNFGITEPMGSPTFVISKYYDLKNQAWKRLVHIDAYRLDGQNLEPLDFPTLFSDPNNIVIIEWPEYIASVLPKQHTSISITLNENDSRTIDIV